MGRTFPFRGERGKVRNRRDLVVRARPGEGRISTQGGHSLVLFDHKSGSYKFRSGHLSSAAPLVLGSPAERAARGPRT